MLQPLPRPARSTALFLARRDDLLTVDRAQLRGCGVRHGRFFSRGSGGLDWLCGPDNREDAGRLLPCRADLVVCDVELEDMSAIDFVRELRAEPGFEDIPVLLLTDRLPPAMAATLGQLGRTAVLCRPYTRSDLDATLRFLERKENSRPLLTASRVPVRVLPFPRAERKAARVPQNSLALGRRFLAAGDYENAADAFRNALRSRRDRAAAFRGLADAQLGMGRTGHGCRFLRAAARFFIMDEDFFNARRALARELDLTQGQPASAAENPLYQAACRHLRDERPEAAARAVLQGLALTPSVSPLSALRRVCEKSDDPWQTAQSLCDQLDACGGANTAVIFRRLLVEEKAAPRPGRLGFLSDILTVARHTYRMYRAAGM